ncbi:MAG TPA: type II toxin-antitoxin system HicB family antitoxin [Gemmatimonadota bacterium]|nr:type II toxin-antitoxin system HicB family antitoxin [Gemmatimonadota bacterium]
MPELTAVFQKVPEGYIGFVQELPGANTQGATLEEARANLAEAVQLILEANRASGCNPPEQSPYSD